MKYGIKFPINEVQFGRVIHFLDLCIYLDENNRIHYCGYAKPTDAKRYLNPLSFHPASVFNSIPFSQLLRTLRNNSKIETRNEELLQCVSYFKNSGYNPDKLQELKEKAIIKHSANITPSRDAGETLVFPVHYFHGIGEFKKLVKSVTNRCLSPMFRGLEEDFYKISQVFSVKNKQTNKQSNRLTNRQT